MKALFFLIKFCSEAMYGLKQRLKNMFYAEKLAIDTFKRL